MSDQNQGVVVITGASSGIGKSLRRSFCEARLRFASRGATERQARCALQRTQQKYGIKVDVLVADLANYEDLKKVGDAIASNDRIAILATTAGTAVIGASAEIPIQGIEDQLDVNVRAVTHLSQAILPAFVKRNSGTLINLGSVLSFFALPFSTSYSASKAHVMLYTIGLRDELAGTGVQVQLVLAREYSHRDLGMLWVSVSRSSTPKQLCQWMTWLMLHLPVSIREKTVTLPSVEDASLWEAFDAARIKLFHATQTKNPASRYGLEK